MGTAPPLSELIAQTMTSAVHLETRDAYTPDDPQFLDWKAGRPLPVPADQEWYDLVRANVARGVRFRRARVVSGPLADFTRFEYECTAALNIAAGEDVRCDSPGKARQAAACGCSPTGGTAPVSSRAGQQESMPMEVRICLRVPSRGCDAGP